MLICFAGGVARIASCIRWQSGGLGVVGVEVRLGMVGCALRDGSMPQCRDGGLRVETAWFVWFACAHA